MHFRVTRLYLPIEANTLCGHRYSQPGLDEFYWSIQLNTKLMQRWNYGVFVLLHYFGILYHWCIYADTEMKASVYRDAHTDTSTTYTKLCQIITISEIRAHLRSKRKRNINNLLLLCVVLGACMWYGRYASICAWKFYWCIGSVRSIIIKQLLSKLSIDIHV